MADQDGETSIASEAARPSDHDDGEGPEISSTALDEEEEAIFGEEEDVELPGDEEPDASGLEEEATTVDATTGVTEEEDMEQTRETSAVATEEEKTTAEEGTISQGTYSPYQEDISDVTLYSVNVPIERDIIETVAQDPTADQLESAGAKNAGTPYLTIEETILDDLGNEQKVEQMFPILGEYTEYERVSLKHAPLKNYEDIERTSKDSLLHYYIQRTHYLIEKTLKTDQEADRYVREYVTKEFKSRVRPPVQASVFRKTIDEEGNEITMPVITADPADSKKDKAASDEDIAVGGELWKKRILYLEEARLNERLKNILIKIALEKKKQKKLIKLISLSIEFAENPGKKKAPKKKDKPDEESEWVFRNKTLDDWKPLYLEQLMEHKHLRSKFLEKLEIEREKMNEARKKAVVLDAELDEVRQNFIGRLKSTLPKLKPKTSDIFKVQSPEMLVEQITSLEMNLMKERKVILEKQSKVDRLKKVIEDKKKSENSLCYKFDTFTKEIDTLNGKNDRRNKKLEILKKTIRDNCLSLAHTDQKLVSARRNIENQNEKLAIVQDYLLQNRMKRQEIHKKRILIEKYIDKTMNTEEAADYQMLQREYENLQLLMNAKKTLLLQMKQDLKEQQSFFTPSGKGGVMKASRVDYKSQV